MESRRRRCCDDRRRIYQFPAGGYHDAPKRKLKYDIEAVLLSDDENWVGINQILSNKLVEYFFNEHELDEIVSDFDSVQREVNLGISKLDFKVGDTYLEVKTPLTTIRKAFIITPI